MNELIKILEEIKEYQMQNVQLARTTEVYKLADKAQKMASKLFGVNRSIGESTKPILKELTEKLLDKGVDACSVCIYDDYESESNECHKCIKENNPNQYYG